MTHMLDFFFLIYLFLTVLGLRFCVRAFSSCGERWPLFIAVRGPLTIAPSLVAEHLLQTRRLSSCGSRAQLLHGMWDLPRPGLEPVSPALAGRFLTTAPPPLYRQYSESGVYGSGTDPGGRRQQGRLWRDFGRVRCSRFQSAGTPQGKYRRLRYPESGDCHGYRHLPAIPGQRRLDYP